MSTSNKTLSYTKPNPFVLPNKFADRSDVPLYLPRETMFYSAQIIEEIMVRINEEYDARGKTRPTWKAYRAGTDNYTAFTPNLDGTNVRTVAVKFFPAIVKDIQNAIDNLIGDSAYGDTRASYFARTFGDNTIHNPKGFWSSTTKIRDGYIVPATNEGGTQTLNPFSNIRSGEWAFPVDSTNYSGVGHVENPLVRIGINFHGDAFVKRETGSIESSASGWPQSVVGKVRTEQDVAIVNGRLVTKKGSSVTGVDGIEVPMRPAGRPGSQSRVNVENTSQGIGAGMYDADGGYGFLAHHPLVLQQLRWQPPIMEKFDGVDKIPDEHYTQRIYSNTTINLGFVFSHPTERMFYMNWGYWLIKGKAKSDNTGLTLIASPDQYNGLIVTDCPYSAFYPPPSTTCSCLAGDTSYAVWGSQAEPLIWNGTIISQPGGIRSQPKRIGIKTRIKVKHTYTTSPGSPIHNHYYAVCVRLNSIGTTNLQPFIPIYVAKKSDPELTLPTYKTVRDMTLEGHADGSVSLNIIEAIKKSYPQYNQDSDFILAMAIFVHQSVAGSKVCPSIDLPGGSIIDPACAASLSCSMGTVTTKTSYVQLFEPSLEAAGDPRLPS